MGIGICVFLFLILESLDSKRCRVQPEASVPMFPTFAVLVNGFAGSFHDNGSFDDGQSSPGSCVFPKGPP